MSAKDQLAVMLDFIGEQEARQMLRFAKSSFKLKAITWDDIEEDDPMPDELAIIERYNAEKPS